MAQKYRLRDVFTPGGMPSVTYVKRDGLKLEKSLQDAIDRGHSIVTVSGPTKSGKTVLCRTVVKREGCVWLEGGRVKEESDFWQYLAGELAIAAESVYEKTATSGSSGTISAGGSVGLKAILQGKFDTSAGETASESFKRSDKQTLNIRNACLVKCRETNTKIVIDDFHFISKEIQRHIVNALKSAIFDGLDVIIIAVPHRAFDPLSVQAEMQGRFVHLKVAPWTQQELSKIIDLGFPALNVEITTSLKDRICAEAHGNPLIVQDLCHRICISNDIRETVDIKRKIDGSNFDQICKDAAEHSGFPIFDRLARGPQSRKDRKMRPLRDGGEVDTYQAILLAVTELNAKESTTYDELRSAMRDILDDGWLPQKNEVTSACGHMSSIAKTELENVEPIEWHNDSLVISDPFLLFFIRWQKDTIRRRLIGGRTGITGAES